jgi:hypothetical protein
MQYTKVEILGFFNKLIEKGVISKDDILFDDDEMFNLNIDEIVNAVSNGYDLFLDPKDGLLKYVEEGVIKNCPAIEDGIENSVEFLNTRIPSFSFKIDKLDSSFKAKEIESIYTASVVAAILGDEFKEEFIDVIRDYNFLLIEDESKKFKTFSELINEWLSFQSKTIQAIISACRENIASKKEQYSSLDTSLIKREERLKLEVLKDEISSYFNSFKREKLNHDNTSKLKKYELYKLYDTRNSYIKDNIIGNPKFNNVRTIYFIDKLNFEDVNIFVKKKIQNSAKLQVKSLYGDNNLTKEVIAQHVNNLFRKGIKVYLKKWKNDELRDYLEDRILYKLPLKG